MTLLRAADLLPPVAPPRPLLSTIAELSVAPPPRAPMPDQTAQPGFSLISALDAPGRPATRRDVPEQPGAAAWQGAPAPAPLLPAAAVTMPLSQLFRLLAAGTAASADMLATLHAPRRAPSGR